MPDEGLLDVHAAHLGCSGLLTRVHTGHCHADGLGALHMSQASIPSPLYANVHTGQVHSSILLSCEVCRSKKGVKRQWRVLLWFLDGVIVETSATLPTGLAACITKETTFFS